MNSSKHAQAPLQARPLKNLPCVVRIQVWKRMSVRKGAGFECCHHATAVRRKAGSKCDGSKVYEIKWVIVITIVFSL